MDVIRKNNAKDSTVRPACHAGGTRLSDAGHERIFRRVGKAEVVNTK